MGRKPNALILEFFMRGPKLEDQSNRYRHTCKRCGLVFPKGRPDSLNKHLFEKCPNITEEDRKRALTRAQEAAQEASLANDDFTNSDMSLSQLTNDHDTPLSIQLALQREPSALDTLAEVSRHHLDLSRNNLQPNGNTVVYQHQQDMNNDMDGLFAQLQQQLHEPNGQGEDDQGVEESFTNDEMHTSGPSEPSSLVQAASAANQLQASFPVGDSTQQIVTPPEQSQASQEAGGATDDVHLDPQLQASDNQQLHAVSEDDEHRELQMLLSEHQAQSGGDMHSSQHQHELVHHSLSAPFRGYGLLQKPLRKQPRSRFSEEGRKKVGGIRKLGACLRCRMLKKPCSGETPCSTCRTIESARLWKNSCIRTRVAEEFVLYNKRLFYAKAHHKVNLAMTDRRLQRPEGRIEATLFPEGKVYASFKPMAAIHVDNELSHLIESAGGVDLDNAIFLIDFEADDMTTKLERYLVDETDKFIESEPSHFLRVTLKTGTRLIQEQGDILLAKAINLWTATNVLVKCDQTDWTISFNPDKKPMYEPETTDPGPHSVEPDQPDYNLIKAQLLDATERYCATQGKAVMAELERRLLARQQTAAFITFLVSVILLNCVERMSLLYKSFEVTTATDPQLQKPEDRLPLPQGMPTDWPLDAPPSAFWTQGSSFASLLNLLLRLRALPPQTLVREDGSIAVLSNSKFNPLEIAVDGTHDPHLDMQQVLMAQWVGATGITVHDLQIARDISDDVVPSVGAWDLRFISSLLLPEGM